MPTSAYSTVNSGSPGVLFVSYPAKQANPPDYVTTDRSYYVLVPEGSAMVQISGRVSSDQPVIALSVRAPDGAYYETTWNTDPEGYFALPYLVDFSAPSGTYHVMATYEGGQVSTNFYVMRS